MAKTKTTFKKGRSGNPKGRPPVLLPELQRLIDGNRNALKAMIIEAVVPEAGAWLKRIIEQGKGEGDIVRFKGLLEMALGKLIDDPSELELTDDEKLLIAEYRRRKEASRKLKAPDGKQ